MVWRESPSIIAAYDARLSKLERKRVVIAQKAAFPAPQQGHLEHFIELAMIFLSSPWKIYENGDRSLKQTVLRLAFAEPIRYCLHNGYPTPKTTLPFDALGEMSMQKEDMVL